MKLKRVLGAIILLGVISSLLLAWQRAAVEDGYKRYEVTMPLSDVLAHGQLNDMTLQQALQFWQSAGVDSITVNELSLRSMQEMGLYDISLQLMGNDVIVTANHAGIKFLAQRLQEKLAGQRKIERLDSNKLRIEGTINDFFEKAINSQNPMIEKGSGVVVRTASIVEFVGLGYLDEQLDAIENVGLAIRFRPLYVYDLQLAKPSIDEFFDYVAKYSQQPYVVFGGNNIVGGDSHYEYLLQRIEQSGMAIGLIENSVQREHIEQLGVKQLVEDLDYRAVRVFSTWDYIRDRYDYDIPLHHHGEEVINTFYRAISERNIRVIYFKPFMEGNKLIDVPLSVYQENFDTLKQRLAAHGIVPYSDKADTADQFVMLPLHASRYLQWFCALGVIASLLLLLAQYIALASAGYYTLLAIGTASTALIYMTGKGLNLANAGFALLATISFSLLAISYIFKEARQLYDRPQSLSFWASFSKGLQVLIFAVLIALAGGFIQVAFLADSRYLLEMAIFRGVKISQIVPLIGGFFIAIYHFGSELLGVSHLNAKQRLRYLLNAPIKVWQVVIGAVILAALALLLLRSGHESNVQPPMLELLFRNTLEYFLLARPRTKAFLIGLPMVICFIQLVNSKKYLVIYPIFAFLVGIGAVDILNTFSHIRTPLRLSLWRVLWAVALALPVYFSYLLIALLASLIGRRLMRALDVAAD